MIKKILILVAVLLIALVIFVYSRPSDFQVTRSVHIDASPAVVFSYVNNQLKWEEWSPWANLDPEAKKFFGDPESGVGSVYTWSGNDKVGAGSSIIIESKEAEFVKFKLDFEKPRKGNYISEFYFLKQPEGVLVSWNMSGEKDFISKVLSFFMDCEEMTGADFDKGLANLKALVEKGNR